MPILNVKVSTKKSADMTKAISDILLEPQECRVLVPIPRLLMTAIVVFNPLIRKTIKFV
jgi:hypothetical protein